MENNKLIPKLGSGIAVVCILFLPFVGCGEQNFTGLDILQHKEVGMDIKLFLAASILCGVAVFFLKEYLHYAISAIAGIITLIIAYLIAHNKNEAIELKFGAFLAIIGYVVTAITSYLKINEKKNE